MNANPSLGTASLDLNEYVDLAAGGVDALLDRLDLVLTYGQLSTETRTVIESILADVTDPEQRVKTALYMILTSPDYVIAS